jgi:hypothetical protein
MRTVTNSDAKASVQSVAKLYAALREELSKLAIDHRGDGGVGLDMLSAFERLKTGNWPTHDRLLDNLKTMTRHAFEFERLVTMTKIQHESRASHG